MQRVSQSVQSLLTELTVAERKYWFRSYPLLLPLRLTLWGETESHLGPPETWDESTCTMLDGTRYPAVRSAELVQRWRPSEVDKRQQSMVNKDGSAF